MDFLVGWVSSVDFQSDSMTKRKKSMLEQLDRMLVDDFIEVRRGLETADRMMVSDLEEIKRWGRPRLYDDDFHKKKRESMRRLRSSR